MLQISGSRDVNALLPAPARRIDVIPDEFYRSPRYSARAELLDSGLDGYSPPIDQPWKPPLPESLSRLCKHFALSLVGFTELTGSILLFIKGLVSKILGRKDTDARWPGRRAPFSICPKRPRD